MMSGAAIEGGGSVPPLAQFRVREGCRFGAANQYGPGDVVELPAAAAVGFADKLEPVEVQPPADAEPKPRKRGKEAKDESDE